MSAVTKAELNEYFSKRNQLEKVRLMNTDLGDHIWNLFQFVADVKDPSPDLLQSLSFLADEFDLDHTVLGDELRVKVGELLNNPGLSYTSSRDLNDVAAWGTWNYNE